MKNLFLSFCIFLSLSTAHSAEFLISSSSENTTLRSGVKKPTGSSVLSLVTYNVDENRGDFVISMFLGRNRINDVAAIIIHAINDATIEEGLVYEGRIPRVAYVVSGNAITEGLTFTLSGEDSSHFMVNPKTGKVSMKAPDYEDPKDADGDNFYEITLNVLDGDGNTASVSWKVQVVKYLNHIENFNIRENETRTFHLFSENYDSSLYFGVLNSFDRAKEKQKIFKKGRGPIGVTSDNITITAPDFENPLDGDKDNVYHYFSHIILNAGAGTIIRNWTITVEDVEFAMESIANTTIMENSVYNGPLPIFPADDPAGIVTYTIEGVDAGQFQVNNTTGKVSMKEQDYEHPRDFNGINVYSVTLVATDTDSANNTVNTVRQDWTVTIVDELELANFQIKPIQDANVSENTVFNFQSTLLGDDPIGKVTYTLVGDDVEHFSVIPDSGNTFIKMQDYEQRRDANGDNIYTVTLVATDSDNNTARQDWNVTVKDVKEIANFQIKPFSETSIAEHTEHSVKSQLIGDDDPIDKVTYTLEGDDVEHFSVNPDRGNIFIKMQDYEQRRDANGDNIYTVTLVATDSDENTARQDWTVTIEDVRELANFTINPIPDAIIAETTGYTGPRVQLSGNQHIGILVYTLEGADARQFTVDALTGLVIMSSRDYENPLDKDGNNTYKITLVATDSDKNIAKEQIEVLVLDVQEQAVFTIDAIADVNIAENIVYSGPLMLLSGDPHIGTLKYTLSGNDKAQFTIDSKNGKVSMRAQDYLNPKDSNSDNVYYAIVIATDEDNNNAIVEWNVVVQKYEVDDNDSDDVTDVDGDETDDDESEDDNADGDETNGDESDGDETDGDETDGVETDDDETDGDETDGDETDGDETDDDETDGDEIDDDATDDDATNGDETDGAETDDDETDGDETDGDETDGDETEDDNAEGNDTEDDEIVENKKTDNEGIKGVHTNKVLVAEAFTPNGDGINDFWVIPKINEYPNNRVSVHMPNGQKVFTVAPYKNNWQGEFHSKKMPHGSYMYIIDLGNGTPPLRGWLLIVRE